MPGSPLTEQEVFFRTLITNVTTGKLRALLGFQIELQHEVDNIL